jgi:hypothetical protein
MTTCEDCKEPIERKPKGPAPKRCGSCATARKTAMDKSRPRKPAQPKEAKPRCCRESATGRCPQHRQARKTDYDSSKFGTETTEVARLFHVLGQGWQTERLPSQPKIDANDPELIRLASELKAREDEREAADRAMWGKDEYELAAELI